MNQLRCCLLVFCSKTSPAPPLSCIRTFFILSPLFPSCHCVDKLVAGGASNVRGFPGEGVEGHYYCFSHVGAALDLMLDVLTQDKQSQQATAAGGGGGGVAAAAPVLAASDGFAGVVDGEQAGQGQSQEL